MKLKYSVSMVAFVLSTASFGAAAADYGFVPPPNYPLPAGSSPKLFPSEQGAYVVIESLMQIAESWVVQNGCVALTRPITVTTDSNGNGSGLVGWATDTANNLSSTSAVAGAVSGLGRSYTVRAGGALKGTPVSGFNGTYYYNIGSQILSGTASWSTGSSVSTVLDPFTGQVIKDFWRPAEPFVIPAGDYAGAAVSSVADWGYQVVNKKYYPSAKYWQASRTWRHDGVSAETHFQKIRVAPSNSCTIAVDFDTTTGSGFQVAGIEQFSQVGTLKITSSAPVVGPYHGNK